ncbi:MAG: methyltransferase domain-containing protein [Chitinophagaceae bacterium]|nr:methyltransferase domain-containing protein [Chitinophagaceae bacterium]
MIECPLTGSAHTRVIYTQRSVPLIQNKVYPTREEARNAPCMDVVLAQSLDNGFVFSAGFKESVIDYDMHYQNEQSHSAYFQHHLEQVIDIMQENRALEGKVVEIGCGKAYFMDMLLDRGVDVIGFDPTYEGDSPKVVKDFFSSKYSDVGAEFIILRHTLEHIAHPYHFIKTIAAANDYKGRIYIEVPTFEWIMAHNATEDIFYEHCNYFTLETLQMLFNKSVGGHFFNGQYIYVIAELSEVKAELEKREVAPYEERFSVRLQEYDAILRGAGSVAIWGAGAKGSTFLNLLDKAGTQVKCVIDINPKKQHQYVGGTGHYIIRPDELKDQAIDTVVVMNINYIDEIRSVTEPLNIKLITL